MVKWYLLILIIISSVAQAEECKVEMFGYRMENGILRQTTIVRTYHYDVFDTFEEARKHGEVFIDYGRKKYVVFYGKLPDDAFTCAGMSYK